MCRPILEPRRADRLEGALLHQRFDLLRRHLASTALRYEDATSSIRDMSTSISLPWIRSESSATWTPEACDDFQERGPPLPLLFPGVGGRTSWYAAGSRRA